jgi:5'-3' exonuclease
MVGRWFYERATGSYNTLLAREGSTPAKLKALKEAIPPARKITKTDLAKFINAWDKKPDIVSKGSQKNFDNFMATLDSSESDVPMFKPTAADYKAMISKAKIFKETQKLVRPMFQAFQANVAAYTVSLLSEKLGSKLDLEKIWLKQALSPELLAQIGVWANEVNEVLHKTANGRMVSEWAKKPECREALLTANYSAPTSTIPEVVY